MDFKELEPFCNNSRRWLNFAMVTPKSCLHPRDHMVHCDDCGYFEWRKPTSYVKEKHRIIEDMFKD